MWRYGIGRDERFNYNGVSKPVFYLAKIWYDAGGKVTDVEKLGFDSDSTNQLNREIAMIALDVMNNSVPVDVNEDGN